jgi:hypothetical protein
MDSGWAIINMATVCRGGQMVLDTKVCGTIVKQVERESSGTLTATFLKESGKMTKQMASAFIHTLMALITQVFGRMTCSTGRVKNFGWTEVSTLATIESAGNINRANTGGQMEALTTEIGKTIRLKVLAPTLGQMGESTLEAG